MKYIVKTSESPEVNSAQPTIVQKIDKVYGCGLRAKTSNTMSNRHTLLDAKKSAIILKINIDKKLRNKKY